MNRFQGKVVAITGASSGIGAACARSFSNEGAKVVVVGRDRQRTAAVAQEVNALTWATSNITDPNACRKLVQTILDAGGRLDVLINNAGTIIRKDTADTTDEQWRQLMAINLDAPFFMAREAIKVMRRQGSGAIVNLSSTCGLVGCKGLMAYSTSKGAIIQMTQSMALDCAVDGIRVNAVCPGAVDTPMLFSKHEMPPTREQMQKVQVETVPMQRWASTEEVVQAIMFMASDQATYTTGAFLSVDGGYTCQ
ncbi:MAG: SDR family NAD(P)-dependent oxidoreductase [Desulfobacterales bacterium]|jgi:meso-butanediol dehydrogenase/(S,S)-butanediol dehydrogenase/diacetyl reductase